MKKQIRNLKIGKKLLISYLIACVIPLVIVSCIIYRVSARKLEESALEFTSIFSSQIVSNLNIFMDEYDRVTKSLLVDNDVIAQVSETDETSITAQLDSQLKARRLMMRLQLMEPEVLNSMFLTEKNKLYNFSQTGDTVNHDTLREQTWFMQMMDSSETLMISAVHDKAYYDENQDGIVVTVGRKILDSRGAYIGILLMDIDPSSIIELSDGFLLARNQYNIKISIVNSGGGVLYDSDVASGRLTWNEAMSGQNSLLYQKNEKDYIILTEKTKKAGLSVHAVIPRSTLLLKIEKIKYVTVISLAVSLVLVVVMSVFLSRGITRPIRELQGQMKQAEAGHYQVMEGNPSGDEIGELVTSYNHMILEIKHLIEEVYAAQLKEKDAQYLALQTQINPHMLYNTLEAIRMTALVNGDDEVADMIKILAKMFRSVLSIDPDSHTIQKEIDYAENYIRLQNIRYPDMFHFAAELDGDIRECRILSMVLQPIIENSIEHGFRRKGEALHMTLAGHLDAKGDVHLLVTDDGKGILPEKAAAINRNLAGEEAETQKPEPQKSEPQESEPQESEPQEPKPQKPGPQKSEPQKPEQQELEPQKPKNKRSSIGLKNIAERIRLQYGRGYFIRILQSGAEGTTVEICIPGKPENPYRVERENEVQSHFSG